MKFSGPELVAVSDGAAELTTSGRGRGIGTFAAVICTMARSLGRRRGSGIRPVSGCLAGITSVADSSAAAVCAAGLSVFVGCVCCAGGHGALVCDVVFCCGAGGHAFGAVASGLDSDRDVSAACALTGIVTGISADFAIIGVGEASVIFVVFAGTLTSLAGGSFDEPDRSRASVAVALASTVNGDGAGGRACSAAGRVLSLAAGFALGSPMSVAVSCLTDGSCGTATWACTKVVTACHSG